MITSNLSPVLTMYPVFLAAFFTEIAFAICVHLFNEV